MRAIEQDGVPLSGTRMKRRRVQLAAGPSCTASGWTAGTSLRCRALRRLSSFVLPRRMDDVPVFKLSCGGCWGPFFICRRDYRGQGYCSADCRMLEQAAFRRFANAKHPRSAEDRRDHVEHQRETAARKRAEVQDPARGERSRGGRVPIRERPAVASSPRDAAARRSRTQHGTGVGGAAGPPRAGVVLGRHRLVATAFGAVLGADRRLAFDMDASQRWVENTPLTIDGLIHRLHHVKRIPHRHLNIRDYSKRVLIFRHIDKHAIHM